MGAFALVALAVGGPLGMCLALAYGVVGVMKIAKVDSQYAARGETPPSYRLVEKWLDRRKAAGTAPADAKPAQYGMWRYAWQRWQASWEVAAQQHRIEHDKRLKEIADAAERGEPIPKGPTLRERSKAGFKWVIDKLTTPIGEKPAVAPATGSATAQKADGPVVTCPDCGQALTNKDGTWQHPSSAGCPKTGTPAANSTSTTPSDSEASATPRPAPTNKNTGGNTMTATAQPTSTQQSGEVVGLISAINYAAAVAAAHEAHSQGGGETYTASLAQAEVGPETIQSAGAAQEASQIAAAAWRAHEAKLKEQLAAKEAVTAETGSKNFLLAE